MKMTKKLKKWKKAMKEWARVMEESRDGLGSVKDVMSRLDGLEVFKAHVDKMLLNAKFKAVFGRLKKLEFREKGRLERLEAAERKLADRRVWLKAEEVRVGAHSEAYRTEVGNIMSRLTELEAPQERALRVDLDIDARLKELETFKRVSPNVLARLGELEAHTKEVSERMATAVTSRAALRQKLGHMPSGQEWAETRKRLDELETFKARTLSLDGAARALEDRMDRADAYHSTVKTEARNRLDDLETKAKEDRARHHRMLKRLRTLVRRDFEAMGSWLGEVADEVKALSTPPSISDAEMAEAMRESEVKTSDPEPTAEDVKGDIQRLAKDIEWHAEQYPASSDWIEALSISKRIGWLNEALHTLKTQSTSG